MSARIANACIKTLRLRRLFDINALTVWVGVMGTLLAASGASLAMA